MLYQNKLGYILIGAHEYIKTMWGKLGPRTYQTQQTEKSVQHPLLDPIVRTPNLAMVMALLTSDQRLCVSSVWQGNKSLMSQMPKLGTALAADVAYLYRCLPVCSFVLLDLVHLYGLCSAVPPSSGSWTPPLRFRSPLILLLDSEVASAKLFFFLTLSEILFASLLGFCLQNFFELIQLDYCLFNPL